MSQYKNVHKPRTSFSYQYLLSLEKIAFHYLKQYSAKEDTFNNNRMQSLINQSRTKFVHDFKEMMIDNELNEIMFKMYSRKESYKKLKKIVVLYSKYVNVFPNYLVIDVEKAMSNNITNKQRLINLLYESIIFDDESDDDSDDVILSSLYESFVNKSDTHLNRTDTLLLTTNRKNFKMKKDEKYDSIDGIENLIKNICEEEALRAQRSQRKKKTTIVEIDTKRRSDKAVIHLDNESQKIIGETKNANRLKSTMDFAKLGINRFVSNCEQRSMNSNESGKKKFKETFRFYVGQMEKERYKINFKKEKDIIKNSIFSNIYEMNDISIMNPMFFNSGMKYVNKNTQHKIKRAKTTHQKRVNSNKKYQSMKQLPPLISN